jgi:hypothetical protein
MREEFRNLGKRFLRYIKVVGDRGRFSDRLLFHDFLAASLYHGSQIPGDYVIRFAFHVHLAVIHPNGAICKTPHGVEIVRDK